MKRPMQTLHGLYEFEDSRYRRHRSLADGNRFPAPHRQKQERSRQSRQQMQGAEDQRHGKALLWRQPGGSEQKHSGRLPFAPVRNQRRQRADTQQQQRPEHKHGQRIAGKAQPGSCQGKVRRQQKLDQQG